MPESKRGEGWSAPATVRIEGGSVGFQIGGSTTDLIMLVMSERGADKLLSSKFTLGAKGPVAAGPVGRTATAQTDAQMRAEILSWSRSQGLFAGIAVEGATLRQDLDDNATLYGQKLENRDIVTTGVRAPEAAARLLALLNRYSARERTRVVAHAWYPLVAGARLSFQSFSIGTLSVTNVPSVDVGGRASHTWRLSSCVHVDRASTWHARGMKPISLAGLMLIVLGLVALVYQGISYTSRETVIDIGPVHATADRQRTLPLPPVLGIAAVAGGVVLLIGGVRKHA